MKEEVIIHRQVKGWMVDIFNIDIDDNFTLEQKENYILENLKNLEFIKRDKLKLIDMFEDLPKYRLFYKDKNIK